MEQNEETTGNSTGKPLHPGSENLRPPWKPGESGNPAGRKPGTVRRWDAVMREFFRLAETDPDELERVTGLKLPNDLRGKDGQLILFLNQFKKAYKGDQFAYESILNRMDGQSKQSHELSGGLGLTVNIVKYSEEEKAKEQEQPDDPA